MLMLMLMLGAEDQSRRIKIDERGVGIVERILATCKSTLPLTQSHQPCGSYTVDLKDSAPGAAAVNASFNTLIFSPSSAIF